MEAAKSKDRLRWEQQLSLAIDFYPSTFPHFNLLNSIIDSWFARTDGLLKHFAEMLQKHEETIHIGMLNSARIEGSSRHFPASGGEQAVSIAQLSLGVFPKALGLTNRAHVARVLGTHDPATADVFGVGPPCAFGGCERWSIKDTSVGMLVTGLGTVYPDTLNSVSDCASLALFHEMAHTQQPFPYPEDEEEFRSDEACADEGSGYLFVRALQAEQKAGGLMNEAIILDRLADASFFLSAMIFWASGDAGHGKNYHHPLTRMRCFFRGACFALYGLDMPRWRKAFIRAWHRQYEYCLALAIFMPNDLWFWQDSDAAEADWKKFLVHTFPRMTAMRMKLSKPSLLSPIVQGMHYCVG